MMMCVEDDDEDVLKMIVDIIYVLVSTYLLWFAHTFNVNMWVQTHH